MASSTLIVDYLGEGPAANRPASLSISSAALGIYYATDTKVLSLWNGTGWDSATGDGLSPIVSNTVLGNVSGSSAVPTALNQAQLTALVNSFTTTLPGAVPASGGGTANFLRADGTWAAPSETSAPEIVQSQVVAYSSSALVVPLTNTPEAGNMLLYVGAKWPTNPGLSPGWSQLYMDGSESSDGLMIVYRYAMPGDTSSITLSTQATGWSGCLFELSGVATGNIVSVQEGNNYSGGGTAINAGSGIPDNNSFAVGMVSSLGAATEPTVTLTGATAGQTAWTTGSTNGGNRFVSAFTSGLLSKGGITVGAEFSAAATGTNIVGMAVISPVR
ncbi:conserved hypothetical protein [Gluconacetobacter diazotrophicus PA1 5]|uniref:hypothetical protein n=1 Tax=Gluconacetobacter diazotrophicus TaxID=33996 RepID=UPI000173D8D1|nr:hypothetical protein [Gluconacetobacter diazotrophicus]ACI52196.1 conserved hypothetical protein [Gluconacetobacter diazotrophicus PA1 5]TWB00425.1 hypothetical protein FBZ86_1365 [Gluconacetobacter diazotrophicus]